MTVSIFILKIDLEKFLNGTTVSFRNYGADQEPFSESGGYVQFNVDPFNEADINNDTQKVTLKIEKFEQGIMLC